MALTALVATFALALPMMLDTLGSWARVSSRADLTAGWAIGLMTFTFAAVVGAQFPLANRCSEDWRHAPAFVLYSADFLGASVGALLTSTLLLPVIGVRGVCLLVAALNVLAGARFWPQRRAYPPSP